MDAVGGEPARSVGNDDDTEGERFTPMERGATHQRDNHQKYNTNRANFVSFCATLCLQGSTWTANCQIIGGRCDIHLYTHAATATRHSSHLRNFHENSVAQTLPDIVGYEVRESPSAGHMQCHKLVLQFQSLPLHRSGSYSRGQHCHRPQSPTPTHPTGPSQTHTHRHE